MHWRTLLLALLFSLAGCSATVEPMHAIGDDAWVAVKPFKAPDARSGWDSPLGHELAIATTDYLRARADFEAVPYSDVHDIMVAPSTKVGDANGLDVRKIGNRQLADLTGADYVLVCKLVRFELKAPNAINMTQGTAVAECALFKVQREREEVVEALTDRDRIMADAWEDAELKKPERSELGGRIVVTRIVRVKYPDDYLNPHGKPFLPPKLVRNELIAKLAREIAKLLYEHEPDAGAGSGN